MQYCSKDVNVANTGEAAIKSHMKSQKVVERCPPEQCIKPLMPPTPVATPAPEPGNVSESSNEAGRQKQLIKC